MNYKGEKRWRQNIYIKRDGGDIPLEATGLYLGPNLKKQTYRKSKTGKM